MLSLTKLLSTLFQNLWEKHFMQQHRAPNNPVHSISSTRCRFCARWLRRGRGGGGEEGGEGGAGGGGGSGAAPAPPGRCQPGAAARLGPPRRPGTSLSAGKATRRCSRWWREGCACVGSSGTGARGRCVLAAGRAGGAAPARPRSSGPRAGPARLRAVPRARMG